ncbi:hypothetical protein HMPREF0666_00136 [Prevotella sp. C561]|nr:hypothetical protein HMPREF0666_00136 [Prevotella sp. C561]
MLCVLFFCVFCEKRMHPLYEMTHKQHAGEFFSHRAHGGHGGFKRTVSSPQNAFGIQSSQRPHPQPPLRMERGVVCEVTPISLLLIEDGPLNILRTYRGISVITPLSIRRGAGGEASVAIRFCVIG